MVRRSRPNGEGKGAKVRVKVRPSNQKNLFFCPAAQNFVLSPPLFSFSCLSYLLPRPPTWHTPSSCPYPPIHTFTCTLPCVHTMFCPVLLTCSLLCTTFDRTQRPRRQRLLSFWCAVATGTGSPPTSPAFLTTTSFNLISFSSCCVLCAGRSKRPPFLLSELRGTNYHFGAVRTPPIFNPLSLQWCSFHVYSSCSVHFFVLIPLFFSSF